MNAYEDLEEKVKARGVRVKERLEILRTLQKFGGDEELAAMVDQHERAIEEAAKKVRKVIR
jgi:glutamate mutase epsilon subunit